jgi:integrase
VLTPEEYDRVISMLSGPFRDLLAMAWESGIRPQEIRIVEARHLDFENGRIVLPVKESKGKKLPRVVYLTDEALEIASRMAMQHPSGPIFRNSDGAPWTRYAINCAFIRLQIAFGRQVMKDKGILVPKLPRFKRSLVDPLDLKRARAEHDERVRGRRKELTRIALEHGQKLHLGAFRKSFATEALKNGVDPVTASHLLGHSNTNMLAKVYARLAQDPKYLRDAAKRAKGG